MKESDDDRVAASPASPEKFTWSELTPEEEKDFFGTFAIGRLRFPPPNEMRLPRDDADREYRARYLTEQLVAWYRRGSDRRAEARCGRGRTR